jgi:hypothetical protein
VLRYIELLKSLLVCEVIQQMYGNPKDPKIIPSLFENDGT